MIVEFYWNFSYLWGRINSSDPPLIGTDLGYDITYEKDNDLLNKTDKYLRICRIYDKN